jgi:hypothetical protein
MVNEHGLNKTIPLVKVLKVVRRVDKINIILDVFELKEHRFYVNKG